MATIGRSAKGAAALVAAFSLLSVTPAVPVLAGPSLDPACVVTNTSAEPDVMYGVLQAAVDAATGADRLTVRGVCHGVTTIDRDLTIVGVTRKHKPLPILDGDAGGSVVTVNEGVTVTVRTLRITDGSGSPRCGGRCPAGGGIDNSGTATLDGVVVDGSTVILGGGIYNIGTLTLTGAAVVRDNSATGGGGIHNVGTLTIEGSAAVRDNEASGVGGGIFSSGALIVKGSASIDHNIAAFGGGVYGGLVLTGAASVHHNVATGHASGIFASRPTTLSGHASVHHNTSIDSLASGAIEIPFVGQPFTMKRDSSVSGNIGGAGGAGIVLWPDCGDAATVKGIRPRTRGNTPAQVVTQTGTVGCD